MKTSHQTCSFSYPTDIRMGFGTIEQLPDELSARKLKRPLVVSDRFLAETDLIKKICNDLSRQGLKVALFGGVYGNPCEDQVHAGKECYLKNKCDSIVAIGGGASIDAAKAVGLLITNQGELSMFDDQNPQCIAPKNPLPFLAALPTTAGTGSEVGRSTVICDNATKIKKIIYHEYLLPKLVILDPDLIKTLPANIAAATGMDALTHHLEAFLVNSFHPMCDGIALEGLRLIGESLVPAFVAAKKNDLGMGAMDHRANMMAASMMGAVAFQKGLGVNHSIAHALSTVCDMHHGLANAIMLPHVMAFNAKACEKKMARIMMALGAPASGSLSDYLRKLNAKLDICATLTHHGVKKSHLASLVDVAFEDPCHTTNPIAITRDDLHSLMVNALT